MLPYSLVDARDEVRDPVEVGQVVGDRARSRLPSAVASRRRSPSSPSALRAMSTMRADVRLAAHPDRRRSTDALAGAR